MKLSIIHLTYRPGGLGIFLHSLNHQKSPPDYELIIVDDYPGRPERGQVKDYCTHLDIPLVWHGPSKEKSYPKTYQGLLNAMNTGAMQASGNYVLFTHD